MTYRLLTVLALSTAVFLGWSGMTASASPAVSGFADLGRSAKAVTTSDVKNAYGYRRHYRHRYHRYRRYGRRYYRRRHHYRRYHHYHRPYYRRHYYRRHHYRRYHH